VLFTVDIFVASNKTALSFSKNVLQNDESAQLCRAARRRRNCVPETVHQIIIKQAGTRIKRHLLIIMQPTQHGKDVVCLF